jgi:Photoprotection regulator fluorescence recovery protein
MELSEQFDHEPRWTDSEKKTARRAFDKAFERHCASISAEVKRMLQNANAPSDIWRIQEYLTENRKSVDEIYDYRYSRLLLTFSILMRNGWLMETDLAGLQREKIDRIKLWAKR